MAVLKSSENVYFGIVLVLFRVLWLKFEDFRPLQHPEVEL